MNREALVEMTDENGDCKWRYTRPMSRPRVVDFLNKAGVEIGPDDFKLVGIPNSDRIVIFYYSSLDLEKLLK